MRPCSDSNTVCDNDQPSRAAARLKADGAGTTIISRASMCRASLAPYKAPAKVVVTDEALHTARQKKIRRAQAA